jgi:glycosyltransferase involved in cell wall biosynthesis
MVGDGWLLNRARKLASRLRVEDRVTFHGRQDHAFVLERMKRAAIYMQHSVTSLSGDTEGVPTAIQEAMAAGAAIVSTRHAGIPEIVDEGLSGLLVGERDVSGYAAALERLVVDPELRARMGSAARTFAIEHLDYRKLYARLETAMAETIAARKR